MPRPIVLGNGELHVGLNASGLVEDFYYPHVGQENHLGRLASHKVGVWCGGVFSWLDDGGWNITQDYPHRSLIGHTRAHHPYLGIILEFDDFVDSQQAAFARSVQVINCRGEPREVRLYFHQVFAIAGNNVGDTAQYLPQAPAMMHYKGRRVFLASARISRDQTYFNEYAAGLYAIEGRLGTYKDAEDGSLSLNPVEHGGVDSVIGLSVSLDPHDSARVEYWLAAGKSHHEALAIHRRLSQEGVLKRLLAADRWWEDWLKPSRKYLEGLPGDRSRLAEKCLMIIKSHIDKNGAVIASCDSSMLNYSRDSYAYCWPRDAAYALWPLLRMGFDHEVLQFFGFCRRTLHPDGYLMHKYQPDGAVGSSWHPYIHPGGHTAPPIQEDETAIVLFLAGQYYYSRQDERFLKDFYDSLIRPMANFLAGYVDETTKLPKPSYDLWEERFAVSTYTVAAVYAGITAAVRLAEASSNSQDAVRWQVVADDMRRAAAKLLYDRDRRYLVRSLPPAGSEGTPDTVIDVASFYGAYIFGLFDIQSEEIINPAKTLAETFGQNNRIQGGLPRYEHDLYDLADPGSLGNPWAITTLWLAQYYLETGKTDEADELIEWVCQKSSSSGVLAEQYDPRNGRALSVAPLTWSQAELLNTLLDGLSKQA
ncbi:MAG: glycoside hydrolase family 15 protein [Candidatus Chaera renei]|uniref:Glycoside hydrolase family 15 protein n=1 Tax=Candidatus Chaera renei TaxID=2506947 RepID=A0A4Q0AG23_9BACT|nr:MAG: glycoside hydrolase family 15 protein [Candidatus Chaera renei]